MADVPTEDWDETVPAGSDNINLGDNKIRQLKTQVREVINVDHDFPSSGKASDVGQHKRCTLQEQADLGTGSEGVPIFGAQTVSGKAELVFTDEDDNDIQLTSGGKMGSSGTEILASTLTVSGDVDVGGSMIGDNVKIDTNDTYITSKDAAGTGTVNLIKAGANDVAVVPDGAQTATNAAPLNDKDLANKKYVNDQEHTLGSLSDVANNTAIQASADTFVTGYVESDGVGEDALISCYVENANPPTVLVTKGVCETNVGGTNPTVPFSFFVPSGWYYKAVGTVSGGSMTFVAKKSELS